MVAVQNTSERTTMLGTRLEARDGKYRDQPKFRRLERLQQMTAITADYTFRQQLTSVLSPLTEFFPEQILEASIPFLEVAYDDLYGIANDGRMLVYCLGALDLCLNARKLFLKRDILAEICDRFGVEEAGVIHTVRRAKLQIKRRLHDHRLRRRPVEQHYQVLRATIRKMCLEYEVPECLEEALALGEQLRANNYVSKHKEITALTCLVLTLNRVEKKKILLRLGDVKTKQVYNYTYRLKKRIGLHINTRS